MAEIAARVVAVPHRVVLADRDAARTRGLVRQLELAHDERLRIRAADLVRVELVEVRDALRVEAHAVRPGVDRRRLDQLDRAIRLARVENADEVPRLDREEEAAVAEEDQRVRIARLWVRHLVLGDLAGLRIDLPD